VERKTQDWCVYAAKDPWRGGRPAASWKVGCSVDETF